MVIVLKECRGLSRTPLGLVLCSLGSSGSGCTPVGAPVAQQLPSCAFGSINLVNRLLPTAGPCLVSHEALLSVGGRLSCKVLAHLGSSRTTSLAVVGPKLRPCSFLTLMQTVPCDT